MHIVRPSDIVILGANRQPVNGADGKPLTWSFNEFVLWLVNTSERFNATGRGIRAGARIEMACLNGETKIPLSVEDINELSLEAENPSKGYPTLEVADANGNKLGTLYLGKQLLPFIEAITNAGANPTELVS